VLALRLGHDFQAQEGFDIGTELRQILSPGPRRVILYGVFNNVFGQERIHCPAGGLRHKDPLTGLAKVFAVGIPQDATSGIG